MVLQGQAKGVHHRNRGAHPRVDSRLLSTARIDYRSEVPSPDFTHLHCHTEYSLLDGLARVGPLMDAAVKQGMSSLALTDHGVMFGAIEFHDEAKKRGIKPIIGLEAYVAPRTMAQKEGKQDASGFHFVLLAENEIGYRNLLTLASEAQLRGYYYKPRVDKDLLAKHSDGLIALSACLSSEVARHLVKEDFQAAEKAARWYAEVFEDRFYLEVQDHGLAEQRTVNRHIAAMAKRLGIPLVVTNDVHYIAKEHAQAQEILLCVQTGTTMDDPKRMKMDSHEFYLKSAAEMWHTFGSEFPEALQNTMAIAERCNLNLEFGRVQLPEMPVPAEHTVDSYLADICHHRLVERYDAVTDVMRERLDYELSVIKKTGFAAYFLLLDDIIGHARQEGIMVGPGRGSAVGSLASYCLGITNVDPLEFDLLFERFLNPDRLSMPDIDTDFADDRRDEVIRYITERFGADCVAQISTFGTMAAKAAIKDVGRALAIPYGEVDRLCKLIPPMPLKITIKESIDAVAELADLYHNDAGVKRHLDMAMALEHVKRHASTHAAGVVISRDPLVGVTPLVRVGKEGDDGQASQYEAGILDKIGLLKMDILGLTTLTLIQRTIRNIELSCGIVIEPDEIPLDDPRIYELLSGGETAGIFQLESGAMRKVLRDMKPDRFTDIVAVVALYRPGPMNFIPQYIARKNGTEKITYSHPDLEDILKESYGIIVYQDQVLRIAINFAGFTWGEADKLRKAMGKKLVEEMKKQQDHFEEGFAKTTKWEYQQDETGAPTAVEVPKPAYPVGLARQLWPLMETFAGYGFNKCLFAKTYIKLPNGTRMHVSAAYKDPPAAIMAMWPDGQIRPHKVARIVETGRKALMKVTTRTGKVIVATPEHRLLTADGYKRIDEMAVGVELMTVPHEATANQRRARRETMATLNRTPEQRARASERLSGRIAVMSEEEFATYTRRARDARTPEGMRTAAAAMHERIKWLYANDPQWKARVVQASLANVRDCYDTGPGYGRCSIASNGMWCASQPERAMCEWLIAQNIDFEMHKVLYNGRMCDFYFAGIYWEMDGMDRAPAYFAAKYGDLPYVVVTPEDYKFVVEHHLALAHAENGDPIVSIEPAGEGQTYDIEMAPDGPLNFIANEVVSHNSHAAAYAQLACQTAYLKAKYKVEYMAACLSIETGTPDRMAVVLGECRRLGIAILPPDINHSDLDFVVEDGKVRYALQAVKNVGTNAIRCIVEARQKDGPFKDVDDFCRRVDWKALNKRAVESLIKAGALDSLSSLPGYRAMLLGNLDRICAHGQRAERDAASGQVSLFAAVADVEALALPPLMLTTVPDVPNKQLLAWEKEMLGLYVSEHPLTAFQEQGRLLGVVAISALSGPAYATQKVKVGAQVVAMRTILTKKNETMMVVTLEDLEGSIEAVVFPRTYARCKEVFQESAILLVNGTVDTRNDRLQLIVDDIAVFEGKVSTGVERFSVYCRRTGDDEQDLALVQEVYLLLRQFPGKDRVEILTDIDGRRVAIPLPGSTSCCCPELMEKLHALPGVGPDAVTVVAATPVLPEARAPEPVDIAARQDRAPIMAPRDYVDPFAALDPEDDLVAAW